MNTATGKRRQKWSHGIKALKDPNGNRLAINISAVSCCTLALLLSFLCLVAGRSEGFMEDYHLLTVNTSGVNVSSRSIAARSPEPLHAVDPRGLKDDAKKAFSAVASVASSATEHVQTQASEVVDAAKDLPDKAKENLDKVKDKVEEGIDKSKHKIEEGLDKAKDAVFGILEEKVKNVLDSLVSNLHLDGFYSLHLTSYCYGRYTEEKTPVYVVVCGSSRILFDSGDLSAKLEEPLGWAKVAGKLLIKLLDMIGTLIHAVSPFNLIQKTLLVFYCISTLCISVAFLTSVAFLIRLLWAKRHGRLSAIIKTSCGAVATLTTVFASTITTVFAHKTTKVVNKFGNKIGVVAYWGGKFQAVTWTVTCFILLATILWAAELGLLVRPRKLRKGQDEERENKSRESHELKDMYR